MHPPSIWAILIILALAFLLFGKPGRIANLMKDVGEGIKGFRKGISEEDKKPEEPPAQVTEQKDRVQ